MKKLAIIFAAAALVATAPRAHAEGYAGFRAGANLASFTGEDADLAPDTRTGFACAGFVGFDKGKHLGFKSELMYTMKGAKTGVPYSTADADTFVTSEIKLDYIELDALLVARFPLSPRFTMRAFAGPVLGLWINAEADNGPLDVDIGDTLNNWEISGTIGAELDAKAGPYVLLLDARYTQGSRVFGDVGVTGEPLNFTVSNSGITVTAGLMVPF